MGASCAHGFGGAKTNLKTITTMPKKSIEISTEALALLSKLKDGPLGVTKLGGALARELHERGLVLIDAPTGLVELTEDGTAALETDAK